ALVRVVARDGARDARPDDATVARYYAAHQEEFQAPEWVHLREIVLSTEAEARGAIRDAATVPFEALGRERTQSPAGARDAGDLGLVPRAGNDRVPRVVAEAGFAIDEPGGIYPEPVRAEGTVLVGRRQRPRHRVTYHVVQLLGRAPAAIVPPDDA